MTAGLGLLPGSVSQNQSWELERGKFAKAPMKLHVGCRAPPSRPSWAPQLCSIARGARPIPANEEPYRLTSHWTTIF